MLCYVGAYPNHMHTTIIVKKQPIKKRKEKKNKRKTQQHRLGLMFRLMDLVLDCWLEASLREIVIQRN
jgi:hypothetical protein